MRTIAVSNFPQRKRSLGLTLIELMVGLVIGLILALVGSSVYLYSKQSYNAVSEISQAEENGRFALDLLARTIQNAGYVAIDPASNAVQGPSDLKLSGCDFGMTNPQAATARADLACRTAVPAGTRQSASIGVFYETDAYITSNAQYQGFDCVGNRAVEINAATGGGSISRYEVRSYFFISNTTVQIPGGVTTMGQLSCVADSTGGSAGPGGFSAQPLLPGIEQLRVQYLMPAASDQTSAQRAIDAAAVTAADGWANVVAVELCVLSKSIQTSGNDTGTQATDCYGNTFLPRPSESFRTFKTVVNLRNRSSL